MITERPDRGGTMQDGATIPLLEEVAQIDVRAVTTGRVRVSTHVETTEVLAREDLQSEAVDVTRVALNQPVTGPLPQVRTEGDLTIVPVFEEVLVVEKRLILKEELHIRKRTTSEALVVPVTLRHQTAEIERTDENGRVIAQDTRGSR